MNPPDPKWLELLKASGWQTTSLALACLAIVALVKSQLIPTTNSPLWIAIPAIGTVIFGFLSLGAIVNAWAETTKPMARINRWRPRRQEQRTANEFIPYMTETDRKIIGYLLAHNQKMFQADEDGGHAAPLISKGMIRPAVRSGQIVQLKRMPFEVPDHIWSVFEENREAFPYERPASGEVEEYPWAIHWMMR